MSKPPHALIVAGDLSADRHAAELVKELRQKIPDLRITALGGHYLKQVSNNFLYPLVDLGGFGFWEPILKIPKLRRILTQIDGILSHNRPDVVIPVDYYGFNIHVARHAHAKGIPVAYYISPQVWASRPGRIKQLAAVITKMLVIFPFEEALYKKAGVNAVFVGHPLATRLPVSVSPSTEPLHIGLLPGSRPGVIRRHLPIQLHTAELLHKQFPKAEFYLFKPEGIDASIYAQEVGKRPWIHCITDENYEIRKTLSLAISVSGTAALENTLLGIPMVIMYKLSTLTYVIARLLIRVPFVGMPNILANSEIVPELLQRNATPEKIAEAASKILSDLAKRTQIREKLLDLRANLKGEREHVATDEILPLMPR